MKQNKITIMKHRYNKAKKAKVGETITCPYCKSKYTKTTYNKIFCSNQKTKVRRNCKDMFWNNVDPNKRCRNTPYFRNVILEKFAKDRGYPTYDDFQGADFDRDGSWDAHQCSVEPCGWCGFVDEFCICEGVD